MHGLKDPTRITTHQISKTNVVLKARQICRTEMPANWKWGLRPFSRSNPPAPQNFVRITFEEPASYTPKRIFDDDVDADPYVKGKHKMGPTHSRRPGNFSSQKPANASDSDDDEVVVLEVLEHVTPLSAEVGPEFGRPQAPRVRKTRETPALEASASVEPPSKRRKSSSSGPPRPKRKKDIPKGSGPALVLTRSVPGMPPEASQDTSTPEHPLQSPAHSGANKSHSSLRGGKTSSGSASPKQGHSRAEDFTSPPDLQDTGADNMGANSEPTERSEPLVPSVPEKPQQAPASPPSKTLATTSKSPSPAKSVAMPPPTPVNKPPAPEVHVGAESTGVAPHYIPPPSTFNVLLDSLGLNFSSRNLLDLAAGGTFMSITLGAATKLLDDMMINYSEWHTERAPQGKKVNSVEETSSLSDKIDVIMSMLVNGRSNVDPNNVPLASLVAQEENVDVNFIKNNNFNNNAYRNNSGNNYRPYPSANGNGYGNSYENSYNNNRSVPPGLEAMLKEFISTQTAFNKSVEEKLDKIDILASKVDRLASDVDLLKLKVMPNKDIDNKIVTTANAIQVRINENIRLMAELRARWDRKENEKLAKENNVAKVWTITTTSNDNDSHVATPPTINGEIIGVGNVSTPSAKRAKLPEIDKTAEIFSNIGDNDPIAVAHNGLDFDDCNISEVIKFLQKLARSPNASAINLAFTKHITNALIKAREDKLKLETSIPRKLEDGWEPIIKMRVNDFDCNALCDLGASISVMPKKLYDMLDLPPLKNCYLDVNLADNAIKKPLGRIDNVRIMVNNNLVPVDFLSWILNAMHLVPLYWEDLFFELLVLPLI
ncbi:hypothetical protein QYE76_023595 [Lolium multiflorum]|uniref:Reverse transcriptase domain-containing protein n=1 Tax=Lolium multiflorum TaxID=4521 RepID=A0AAD8VV86_LOLMU|nr:hypothetical protein QYE76_023595 [Lolium multiflorum]